MANDERRAQGGCSAVDKMSTRRRLSTAHSPSALLALGCAGLLAGGDRAMGAESESAATRLDTVSVIDTVDDAYVAESSAGKNTAPLLDTPQTVSVIPQAVIRERGARTLTDVLSNTPGISFNAGENGFGASSNNFQLRGFDASGSVFIDNARDSGSYSRDVFNVEQVEVVKGPAADNGRGGGGGFVNLSSKLPQLTAFIRTDASYGLDNYDSNSRKRATNSASSTGK